MKRIILVLGILVLGVLACGNPPEARPKLNLYPTVTIVPTQTPVVVVWTQTPNSTTTPVILLVTPTPNPSFFCVSANAAVYLRPSPSDDNYPIMPVPNGSIVRDLGGRSGVWFFVSIDDKSGWINSAYLKGC